MNAVKRTLGEESGEDEGAGCNSYLLHAVHRSAPQTCLGWSDPLDHFGHGTAPKSGVAPAQQGVLPVAKSKAAPCATLMLPTTSRHPQVTRTVTQKVTCLVCSSVTAPDYLKVTTVEGRSQEHREPVDGIGDGWNGSFFD